MRLLALAAAVFGVLTPAQQVVIADGHIDMGPRFVGGKWTIQIRDDTSAPVKWRPVEDVVLQATSKSQVTVPPDPKFGFLGKAGQRVFMLPQVQQAGILWPGWNTQDTEVATKVNREVTWTVHAVEGPGAFTLFLNADFGKPSIVFDSRKPFPQQTGIDVNTHVHGNWVFDAQGTYLLDVGMTATLRDGTAVSDRRWLRVYAGDADPRQAFQVQPKQAPSSTTPASATSPTSVTPGEPADDGRSWVPIGAGGGGLLILIGGGAWIWRRTKGRHG